MNLMFYGCKNLKTLDLSSFNVEKVNDMSQMFKECSSLNLIDLSNFNIKNVENYDEMFLGCNPLLKKKILTNDKKLLDIFKRNTSK